MGKSASSHRDPWVRLPPSLTSDDDSDAVWLLQRYFDPPADSAHGFTGSSFDLWDSTGTRAGDADRFTADDLAAVSLLGVEVHGRAAIMLLDTHAARFSDLLRGVGDDRDLVAVEDPLREDGPEWTLHRELNALPQVGPTTASKLYARKRPRLRPIYDSVVAGITGTVDDQWEPFRQQLRLNDNELHHRLLRLRAAVGLSAEVSPLRVLDVICWMVGMGYAKT